VLAPIIAKFGPHKRLVLKSGSTFASLSRSIVYQQLAGSAADAIFKRVLLKCEVCTCSRCQATFACHVIEVFDTDCCQPLAPRTE
jgi:3-methyladenine DNA glycosylase/8-oxoguanine DNA glycosylase